MPERSPFFPPSIYCRYLRYCWVFHLNLMRMGRSLVHPYTLDQAYSVRHANLRKIQIHLIPPFTGFGRTFVLQHRIHEPTKRRLPDPTFDISVDRPAEKGGLARLTRRKDDDVSALFNPFHEISNLRCSRDDVVVCRGNRPTGFKGSFFLLHF